MVDATLDINAILEEVDIAEKPSDTSQLVEMECYIASAKDETMSKLPSDVNKSRSHLHLLFEEGHLVSLPLLHSIGSCVNWARRTSPMMEEAGRTWRLCVVRWKERSDCRTRISE